MERKQNVAEIRRLMRERKETASSFSALTRFLFAKGISRPLAEEISMEFAEQRAELGQLKELVAKHIKTKEKLLGKTSPSFMAFVGPTGVGKTLALCRLAHVLNHQEQQVALFSLDSEKSPELKAYAEKLRLPFCESINGAECSLILIDTPGCNFYLPGQIDLLGEKLAAFGEVDILLTLSAAAKDVDLYGAIHQFSPLLPSGLVFTKLDETLMPGSLINISQKTDLPICYISSGHLLSGDIHPADPYEITHRILTSFNEESFHYIRQMMHVRE